MGCHLSVRSTGKLSPIVPQSCVRCVRAAVDLSTKGGERERGDLSMRVGEGRKRLPRRYRGGTGSHLPDLKIRSNRGFRADRDPTEISKVSPFDRRFVGRVPSSSVLSLSSRFVSKIRQGRERERVEKERKSVKFIDDEIDPREVKRKEKKRILTKRSFGRQREF